jgi:hypothetical protein
MAQLEREDVVRDGSLGFDQFGGTLRLVGEVCLKARIVVTVEKLLDILDDNDDPRVRTAVYSYHAHVRNGPAILRYDNQHIWPGHQDAHHKHTYNFPDDDEIGGGPSWVGEDGWPTLSDVIRELEEWRVANYSILDRPEEHVPADEIVPRLKLGFDAE